MHPVSLRAAVLGLLLAPLPAQEPGTPPPVPELSRLRNRMQELEQRLQQLENATPQQPAASQNAFNPSITVFGDFNLSLSDDSANETVNRFSLREVEVDLRAPVTSWADAVLIVALGEELEDDGMGGTDRALEIDIEEGYAELFDLPLDTTLTLGRFRSALGRNNLLHTHDLPQVTRPLAVQAFLGPEGLSAIGAAASWLLPNPFDEYLELRAELVNADGGEESPILGGPDAGNPAVAGHLKWFTDLGETTSLELGGSYLFGRTSADASDSAHVVGADLTLTWRDPERPDWRSLVLGSELFWAHNDTASPVLGDLRNRSFGGYAFAQVQWHRDWYAGVRGDYTEYPDAGERGPFDKDWALSPYVTWYADEFVRFRLEYQFVDRDTGGIASDENFVWLQCTFVFGAHPPHPYWVNR